MMTGLSAYLEANPFLILLLIAHFLSDFHLQSQEMADKKDKELSYLVKHILWVGLPLLVIFSLQTSMWWLLLLIWISHAIIDYLKPKVVNYLNLKPIYSFLGDQLLHLVIILFLSRYTQNLVSPNWLSVDLLTLILFVLLITKPTNICFKLFFQKYQPEESGKMDTIPGAGATIGLLERIVIGVCLIFGQFSSIGLVFTAKSIARYNKISEDPAFAEYYLIGSLFSILSVLFAAWICLY